jgi:PAS domain S-box-containing protein
MLITDRNGTILFSSTEKRLVGTNDRNDLFRQMADSAADEGSFLARGNLGVYRFYSFRKCWLKGDTSPYLYVRYGLSRDYVLSKVYRSMIESMGLLVAFLLLVLVLAYFITRKGILRKVESLQKATLDIAAGNLDFDCQERTSANELDHLACSLANMAIRVRETDQALQLSVRNYRELVENANSIILKWDIDGRILYFNEYAEKLFGFSSEELLGKSVVGTIVPETESSGRDLTEMIRDISVYPDRYANNENENICKNGDRVWISWSNRILSGVDGEKLGILSVGQDISERKKIELQLRKSEDRFRSIVENANDVVFALNPEGVFSYVSPRWKEAFGYDIDETVGKAFVPFVHPDDVQACYEFLQLVMVTGKKQSGVEYRVRCMDGSYIWYKANGSLTQDLENNSFTFIGIGRDISDRKKAEETLHQSEEKFSAAFHASPDAISISRMSDGVFLDVNAGFTTLTGYLSEEVIGKSALDLGIWDNPDERPQLLKRIDQQGNVDNINIDFKHKDGRLHKGQLTIRVIEIDGTPCLLSIGRDVTEHEFLQQELIKAQKLESISVLAGGIAHNFNNVLTGVIGYISYAKKHLADPVKVLPILESAEKSSYRAAGLARQLLTFSKGGAPVKKSVPVDDLVQEAVSLFLTGSNVKSDIVCRTHQPVLVDCQQISQAFNNIILNALHAMPDGGTLLVRIASLVLPEGNRYLLQPGSYAEIVFQDSGCGIRKEDLFRIYDPYFTTKDHGTGLGLSTTLSIISKHYGHIDIVSEVGKGTAVTILLPGTSELSETDSGGVSHTVHNAGDISILLMDDEEMIRNLAENILGEQGYRVKTCAEGATAVELYKASLSGGKGYSLVILDLLIPGAMGGIEAAKHILELDAQAYLIASSGYSSDHAVAEYNQYGFRASIAKPYNAEQLEQAIITASKTCSR